MSLHDVRVHADIPRHGTFTCSAHTLDCMISRHLPASPEELRRVVEAETGLDYSDVRDVTALLIVLGDINSYQYGDEGA